MRRSSFLAILSLAYPAMAQPQQDTAVDWLLSQATTHPSTQPASQPSTQPASPFTAPANDSARTGTIMLSDGTVLADVPIATTEGKPLRFWDEQIRQYRDVPFRAVRSLEAEVVWERDEPEWHFIASGSDQKEYTGKTYPARMTRYVATLLNGQQTTGDIVAPLYVETESGQKTYVLHKRAKGEAGQSLKELIYVKKVEFRESDPRQDERPSDDQ